MCLLCPLKLAGNDLVKQTAKEQFVSLFECNEPVQVFLLGHCYVRRHIITPVKLNVIIYVLAFIYFFVIIYIYLITITD